MISIATAVRRILVLFFISLCLVISGVILFGFNRVIESNRKTNVTRELGSLHTSLQNYLDLRLEILRTYATLPRITQAVEQPGTFSERVKDSIEDVHFFGHSYGVTLYDKKGKIITSTDTISRLNLLQCSRAVSFFSEEIDEYIKPLVDSTGTYWIIGVPVFVNEVMEGALIARVPIADLEGYPILKEISRGHKFEIYMDTTSLFSSGEHDHSHRFIEYERPGSIPEITLKLYVDIEEVDKVRSQLLSSVILLFILFWGITFLFSAKFSRKIIVNPILALEKDMKRILSNENDELTISKENQISEIASFIDEFQKLARQVQERERSLLETQNELKQKNRELVHNQAKLLHADKMASIGQLASGVAHEINNPVGFVLSNTRTLEEYISDIKDVIEMYSHDTSKEKIDSYRESIAFDETLEDLVTLLEDNKIGLKRISSIVQNLKRFSHYDEEAPATPENVNTLIDETLLIARNEIKYVAEVETKYHSLPAITLYRGEVNQVLLNILINAVQVLKEMDRPKSENRVLIKTFMRGSIPTISIFDNGKGISREAVSQIFDPFFSTKPIGSGTGLGLSISYDIMVNKHNGSLEVFSKEGVGTCFFISFPPIEEQS